MNNEIPNVHLEKMIIDKNTNYHNWNTVHNWNKDAYFSKVDDTNSAAISFISALIFDIFIYTVRPENPD